VAAPLDVRVPGKALMWNPDAWRSEWEAGWYIDPKSFSIAESDAALRTRDVATDNGNQNSGMLSGDLRLTELKYLKNAERCRLDLAQLFDGKRLPLG